MVNRHRCQPVSIFSRWPFEMQTIEARKRCTSTGTWIGVLHRYRWRINGVPLWMPFPLPSTTMRRTGSRRAGNTSRNDCATTAIDTIPSEISRRHCCISSIRLTRVSRGLANQLKKTDSPRKEADTMPRQNDKGKSEGKRWKRFASNGERGET